MKISVYSTMLIIKRYCHNIRKIKSWKENINDEVYNLSLRVRALELEREKILVNMVQKQTDKQEQVTKY